MTNLPAAHDLDCYSNSDWQTNVAIGAHLAIDVAQVGFTVRKRPEGDELLRLDSLTSPANFQIANYTVTVLLKPADTVALPGGWWFYDFQLVTTAGVVQVWQRGRFRLAPSIT